MHNRTFGRIVILVACLAGMTWAGLAQAAPVFFTVQLSGAQQVPPVQTSATGKADLTYDPSTRVVTWTITCDGLAGPVTMAHFHVGAEGKNGPVAIWLSKEGSSTSCPISGQAALTPQQAQRFTAGEWYINIHTKAHPPGEMRGQVMPPKS